MASPLSEVAVAVDPADAPDTEVRGVLAGTPFVLSNAAFEPDDQLHTLCMSNGAITAPDCGCTDGVPKIVLYGEFLADDFGNVGWKMPVELRRIGGSGVFELSTAGELTLTAFDPAAPIVVAHVKVTFPSGVAEGPVKIP